jgi:hypothetical protein
MTVPPVLLVMIDQQCRTSPLRRQLQRMKLLLSVENELQRILIQRVLEDAVPCTSDTGQKTGCAATCYAIQRVLRLSLVCDDGLSGGKRCTHGSCEQHRDH